MYRTSMVLAQTPLKHNTDFGASFQYQFINFRVKDAEPSQK